MVSQKIDTKPTQTTTANDALVSTQLPGTSMY